MTMEIKTTQEIIDFDKECWRIINSRQSSNHGNDKINNAVIGTQEKKWVSVNDLKELLFKISDEIDDLITTHNIKMQDKYLNTLYKGSINQTLNEMDRKKALTKGNGHE